MADVSGLVSLWSGGSRLGRPVHHPVQSGSLVPVCHKLFMNVGIGGLRYFNNAEMGVELPLSGVVVLLVAGGMVHHIGDGVSFTTDAHGCGTAAIHVKGISGMEVTLQETGKFAGCHALCLALPAAVYGNHQEVAVAGLRHCRTGMTDALVADGILVIIGIQLLCS